MSSDRTWADAHVPVSEAAGAGCVYQRQPATHCTELHSGWYSIIQFTSSFAVHRNGLLRQPCVVVSASSSDMGRSGSSAAKTQCQLAGFATVYCSLDHILRPTTFFTNANARSFSCRGHVMLFRPGNLCLADITKQPCGPDLQSAGSTIDQS